MFTRLEDLPNELLLHLFDYFDLQTIFHSFWRLNRRWNAVLRLTNDLSLVIEKDERILIGLFARQITRLKVNTSQAIDLSGLRNLRILELSRASDNQIEQVRSDRMPNLVQLSVSMRLPWVLIEEIFSDAFSSLHRVNLTRIETFPSSFNSQSHSLRSIRMTCININVIPQILHACLNLSFLHVIFVGEDQSIPPASFNHSLETLTLDDLFHNLSFETIARLFFYIPNLKSLTLFLQCRRSFLDLMELILHHFEHLSQFTCDIFEPLHNPMVDLEMIRQMHECFRSLQCEDRGNHSRSFVIE